MIAFIKSKKFYSSAAMYLGSSWVIIEAASYFQGRYEYPGFYIDILIILLAFGFLSFLYNEWKRHGKATVKTVEYRFHGVNLLIALTVSYFYYGYRLQHEIQLTKALGNKVSIAVLPFENMSANADTEWLGDALSDQIINQLSLIQSIDVKSRSASFYFKNKDYNSVQIANLLNVNTLLEGTVIVQDSLIRIAVKLINPFSGSQIWNQTFDKPFRNILGIQSQIALVVADKINADITRKEKEKITRGLTQNKAAYEAFVRGKYHWNMVSMADNKRAHDYFKEAIRLDSTMAEAYAYLGLTYDMFGGYWLGLEPDSAYKIVNDLAQKAIRLKPDLGLGHFLKSNYEYMYERDYSKGLETAKKAFELGDSQDEIIWLYCAMLSINKKWDEAIDILNDYIRKNPTSAQAYQGLCLSKLIRDGKNSEVPVEEFYEICNKAMELDPSKVYSKYYLAELFNFRGDYERSRQYWEELVSISPAPHFIEGIFRANYFLGDTVTAMQYFNQLKMYSTKLRIPYVMTRAYSTLGDREMAIKYLQEAYEYRDIEMVNLWFDATLDPIRDDPRFKEILSRLKYAK